MNTVGTIKSVGAIYMDVDSHKCVQNTLETRITTEVAYIKKKRIRNITIESWPASWSSGQSLCLLIMRSRVRFPALPWEFSLKGRIPTEFSLKGRIPTVTMVWVG